MLLLTGPNMGGKSTLMRQVGLISILSQLVSIICMKFNTLLQLELAIL